MQRSPKTSISIGNSALGKIDEPQSFGKTTRWASVVFGLSKNALLRMLAVLAVCMVACTKPSPRDMAAHADVQVTDGIRVRGGVAISTQYVLTDFSLLRSIDHVQVIDSTGATYSGKTVRRQPDIGLGLIKLGKPIPEIQVQLGDSTLLEKNDSLFAQVFDAEAKPTLVKGSFAKISFHQGLAYLVVHMATQEAHLGAGVFGSDATLVGVLAFNRGPDLALVLPIEYAANNSANNDAAIAKAVFGTRYDNIDFEDLRFDAKETLAMLPDPIRFEDMEVFQTFSKTALIGYLRMLDMPEEPMHKRPIRFGLQAIDAEGNMRVLKTDVLQPEQLKWVSLPKQKANLETMMQNAFGKAWTKQNIAPYEYGELRFHIPYKPLCKQVALKEDVLLNMFLHDGRSSGDIRFSGFRDVCAHAKEQTEGALLEKQWGFEQEEPVHKPKRVFSKQARKKKWLKQKAKLRRKWKRLRAKSKRRQ